MILQVPILDSNYSDYLNNFVVLHVEGMLLKHHLPMLLILPLFDTKVVHEHGASLNNDVGLIDRYWPQPGDSWEPPKVLLHQSQSTSV